MANLPSKSDFESFIGGRDLDSTGSQEPAGPTKASERFREVPETPAERPGGISVHDHLMSSSPVSSTKGTFNHSGGAATTPDWQQTPFSGNWEGTYLGARLRMECKLAGRTINGVLRIRSLVGKEDVYHFTGTVENGEVRASHQEGHTFRGKLTQDRRLIGTLTTADGKSIPVNISQN